LEDGDFITSNRDDFLRVVENPANKNALVIIDESGLDIGRNSKAEPMEWLTTTGRHQGYQCILIAQRANQISVNIRTQCVNVFAFRIGAGDADLLAEELAIPELRDAAHLSQYEYIGCIGFKKPFKTMLTLSE